jgi:hypothetical protein
MLRWEFSQNLISEFTHQLWADFIDQVKAKARLQWSEYCQKQRKQLMSAIQAQQQPRIKLSANDSQFIEKLASFRT